MNNSDCTKVTLTLNIAIHGEQKEILTLVELVPNWADLSEDDLETALHKAWVEWAWEYIDGGAQIENN